VPANAACISNPTASSSPSASTSSTPTSRSHPSSALSALTASLEQAKLTENVANGSRRKSTPPQTPRSLSGVRLDGHDIPALSRTLHMPVPSNFHAPPSMSRSGSKRGSSPNQPTSPVGPPRGKLAVKIIAARGLRPSADPYVVCVFDYSEYISKGPAQDEDATSDRSDSQLRPEGGVPIKRSASDTARSLAIPMRSRQGSMTSLQDAQAGVRKDVTDPHWDHEATL